MRAPVRAVMPFVAAAVLALLVYAIVGASGWLAHPLGSCTGSAALVVRCKGYNFWSGIGSDLGEITLLTAVLATYWHHTCNVGRCWRLGRFAHGPLKLCAHHHPQLPDSGGIGREHIEAITRRLEAHESDPGAHGGSGLAAKG